MAGRSVWKAVAASSAGRRPARRCRRPRRASARKGRGRLGL